MNSNLKILLFAHPRSGSTTLMQILNLHPEINLMHEPFNEEREQWAEGNKNYINETKTIVDLDQALEEIHKTYNGFKHLAYQLPEELTEHLLKNKGYKIIFLHRKNHLKSMVSAFIAEQTSVWTPEEKEQKGEPESLKPLDIEEMRKEIEYLKHDLKSYRSMVQQSGTPMMEVTYEDLFTVPDDKRLEKTKKIFAFLNLGFPDNKLEEVESLIAPKRKITNNGTYNLVPNIKEVEKELGSEENGFLFK